MRMPVNEEIKIELNPVALSLSLPATTESLKSLSRILPEEIEIALFKEKMNPDPIIAIKIFDTWFSLFEW